MNTGVWTEQELGLLALTYWRMMVAQSEGSKVNKSALRREMIAKGCDRSHGSIEAKLMNMSAAMVDAGYARYVVKGYKPAPNYQRVLLSLAQNLGASMVANEAMAAAAAMAEDMEGVA